MFFRVILLSVLALNISLNYCHGSTIADRQELTESELWGNGIESKPLDGYDESDNANGYNESDNADGYDESNNADGYDESDNADGNDGSLKTDDNDDGDPRPPVQGSDDDNGFIVGGDEEEEDEMERQGEEEEAALEDLRNSADGDDNNDDMVLKRKKRSFKQEIRLLSRRDHPMDVSLVLLDNDSHHRAKRTSFNASQFTWPHHIPYVFDKNFKVAQKHQLVEAMKFVMNHVCVQFKEVKDYDSSNPNWFKENGYSTNAFIRFKSKSGCSAVFGRGKNDKGGRNISPCTQFFTMVHEVVHSLGGTHSQCYPLRERYLSIHNDNIAPGKKNNFRKEEPDSAEVEYEEFDPSSFLMYAKTYFTKNGLNTFDYIRPEMGQLTGANSYINIFKEINKNYKCTETFCSNEDTDCGPGYMGYTREQKKCLCFCPAGLDPANHCKTVINSATTSKSWPDTPFTLVKSDDDCPAGTETGQVPLNIGTMRLFGKAPPSKSGTLNIDICTKASGSSDFEQWPMGSYCIGKVKDAPCNSPFKEGEFTVNTRSAATLTGSLGEVTASGNKVTMKFCCRSEGDIRLPISFPTDKAFRLILNNANCQAVDGMWAVPSAMYFNAKGSGKGAGPKIFARRRTFKFTSCYYQPPTYGCSQDVKLDSSNPTVTISVPTEGSKRSPDKRCFYHFQAPEGSRMRLTINDMSLHPSDQFLVKRFNLLVNPYKVQVKNPPHQMITEKNVMMIEYWSYFESSAKFSGAKFTVDWLDSADLCYDVKSNGADYAGNKDVTETFEECVPWEDATACPDFPWSGTDGLNLLNSGKSCRNLDSVGMFQPWCYGYVNGTMCTRRYCDVCNEAEPVDKLRDCSKYISEDPNFCSDALGRFGCFKSCNMDPATYNKAELKCSKPEFPSGVSASGGLQDSYDVGATVQVTCGGKATQIECTTHGWTPLDDKCTAGLCVDASQLCQNALAKYPEFCTNDRSKATAGKYCKKTCGLCDAGSCSVSDGGSYSNVSPNGASLSTGQDATFACKEGLHHVSGDLKRACAISGDLLGDAPVCEAKPPPADINIKQIFAKKRYMRRRTVFLMLGNDVVVPFDGKLTRWYYYCRNDLSITLLVYRKTDKAKAYRLVGSNTAPCLNGWAWGHNVPADKQISVQKGDLLGMHDPRGSIVNQPCSGDFSPLAMTKVRNVRGLLRSKVMKFKGTSCGFVSLGARVEPN